MKQNSNVGNGKEARAKETLSLPLHYSQRPREKYQTPNPIHESLPPNPSALSSLPRSPWRPCPPSPPPALFLGRSPSPPPASGGPDSAADPSSVITRYANLIPSLAWIDPAVTVYWNQAACRITMWTSRNRPGMGSFSAEVWVSVPWEVFAWGSWNCLKVHSDWMRVDAGKYSDGPSRSDEWFAQGKMVCPNFVPSFLEDWNYLKNRVSRHLHSCMWVHVHPYICEHMSVLGFYMWWCTIIKW